MVFGQGGLGSSYRVANCALPKSAEIPAQGRVNSRFSVASEFVLSPSYHLPISPQFSNLVSAGLELVSSIAKCFFERLPSTRNAPRAQQTCRVGRIESHEYNSSRSRQQAFILGSCLFTSLNAAALRFNSRGARSSKHLFFSPLLTRKLLTHFLAFRLTNSSSTDLQIGSGVGSRTRSSRI